MLIVRASAGRLALALALLAAASAPGAHAQTTICKDDSDFQATLRLDFGQPGGPTCQEFFDMVAGALFPSKESWADVTDAEIRAAMAGSGCGSGSGSTEPEPEPPGSGSESASDCFSLLGYLSLLNFPAACCGGTYGGSIAKLRGADASSANFCQNSADLQEDMPFLLADFKVHGAGSGGEAAFPGATCATMSERALYLGLKSTSWGEATCEQISNAMVPSFGSGSGSGTPVRTLMLPSCCGGQAVTAAAAGPAEGKTVAPTPHRSIETSACPNGVPDVAALPNGEEACEDQGFSQEQCESVGCCIWSEDDGGRCWSDVGQVPCYGKQCGCADGMSVDHWADPPSCRTECNYDVEEWVGENEWVVGECVTRCANGGAMKLISAAPSAPLPGESAPTATEAEPLGVATITECPGTPGATNLNDCGCRWQYETHGEERWFEDRYKCVKCPDGQQTVAVGPYDNRVWKCYGQDVNENWQVMKCDNGGTLTDATATGVAPTTSDLILSECPKSGSFEACKMDGYGMQTACGCADSGSEVDLFDATGKRAFWTSDDGSDCMYIVEGGGRTNTFPDGYGWRCAKCPDGMQVRFPTSFFRPTCMGCPSGVYPSMHGLRARVRMRVWRVYVFRRKTCSEILIAHIRDENRPGIRVAQRRVSMLRVLRRRIPQRG